MIISQTLLSQRLALIARNQVERAIQLTDWASAGVSIPLGPGFFEHISSTVDEGDWLQFELQRVDWASSPWIARIIEDTIRGGRKDAVVISVGLEGLEKLVEKANAIDTTILLTELWSKMRDSTESFAGFLDKLVGNSVVAVFGAPASHRTDILNAFMAAQDLQKSIMQQGNLLSAQGISSLKVRVGIECGTLWAGCLRVPHTLDLLDYTVVGRPVNVAAMMQAAAKPGEIIAGEEFYEKITHIGLAERVKARTIRIGRSTLKCHPLRASNKTLGKEQQPPPPIRLRRDDGFDYRQGLEKMKQVIKQTDPEKDTWLEFVTLESQLLENIREANILGQTSDLTHHRNRIVQELNRLADQLESGMSFTDLCKG